MERLQLTSLMSFNQVILLGTVLLLVQICWTIVYQLFFHPLAKYPGPLAGKLTKFYMISEAIQMRNTFTRHQLHQKYGKVVRVGPNELSFCDQASIKDIYGQSSEPCLKAPEFYDGFTLTGMSSVFSTTDRNIHARMRRVLSNGLSERGVLEFEPQIAAKIERFLSLIQTQSKKEQPVDLHDLVHNLFMDTVSQLSFAKSFDILEGADPRDAGNIQTYFQVSPSFGIFPIGKYLPFGPFGAAKKARPHIVKFVQTCIDDFRERLQSGKSQAGLLRHMVEAKDEETNTRFTDGEIIENAVIFIIAGSGTSATTLLYILYEMGKRPEMQKQLQDEIRAAFPDPAVFPSFEKAATLPFLNQVYTETLRLRGPIPSAALRLSPGKPIGHEPFVPAGTMLSNLPYTTNRDPSVFPEPESFLPQRWTNPTEEMKRMNRPFQTGPRNCIGTHLARVQILLGVCALYQRFNLRLDAENTTEEGMLQRDLGVFTISGRELWMHATPR